MASHLTRTGKQLRHLHLSRVHAWNSLVGDRCNPGPTRRTFWCVFCYNGYPLTWLLWVTTYQLVPAGTSWPRPQKSVDRASRPPASRPPGMWIYGPEIKWMDEWDECEWMKWDEMKWHEMIWNEIKWHENKLNEMKWHEMNERSGWMNEWMNVWMNEWMNEWMIEWMNERMNELFFRAWLPQSFLQA